MAGGWRTVYVIELDEAAPLPPRQDRSKPYLYVGITLNSPERRFAIHKEGGLTAAAIVASHGVRLRPDLYDKYKKVRGDSAARDLEQRVARELRERGWVVHSGRNGFFWDKYDYPPA